MFRFDPVRCSQAVSVIAGHHHPSRISNSRILSLLYLADRESIAVTGFPITNDAMISTSTGPTLENLSRLLEEPSFYKPRVLSPRPDVNHPVGVNNPDLSELSPHDIDTLRSVCDRHAGASDAELEESLRDLPEWSPPVSDCVPIPVEVLYAALGLADELPAIRNELEGVHAFDDLLASLR